MTEAESRIKRVLEILDRDEMKYFQDGDTLHAVIDQIEAILKGEDSDAP